MSLPNGTLIEYVVDGNGRRVGKKVNGTLVKQWLYADQLRPVAELDGAGNLVSEFVYGSKSNVPDLMVRGGVQYRIVSDQLGSVRLVVNATTGVVAQRMRHDAWGKVLEDTSVGFVPFGFAGGMYDADTGLVRFGARDYESVAGRWMQRDPIRFDGGQANLYAYAMNDQVNFIDRTGRQAIPIPWWGPVGGAAAGAAVGGIPGAIVGAIIGAAIGSVPGDTPIPANDNAPPDTCEPEEPAEICPLQYEWGNECVYLCPRSGTVITTRRHGLGPTVNPANDSCPFAVVYG